MEYVHMLKRSLSFSCWPAIPGIINGIHLYISNVQNWNVAFFIYNVRVPYIWNQYKLGGNSNGFVCFIVATVFDIKWSTAWNLFLLDPFYVRMNEICFVRWVDRSVTAGSKYVHRPIQLSLKFTETLERTFKLTIQFLLLQLSHQPLRKSCQKLKDLYREMETEPTNLCLPSLREKARRYSTQ